MLINSELCIAVKNYYGQYRLRNFSIFKIDDLNSCFTPFKATIDKNREIIIKVKCPICDCYHFYRYSINDVLNRNILVGGCESLGVPLFYIGKNKNVLNRVKRYNEVNKNLFAMI